MNYKTLLHEIQAAFRLESLKRNRHRIVAILAMLAVTPLLAALFGSWFQAGAVTIGGIYLADHSLRRYLASLAARMDAQSSPTWDVEVNQVKVGTITDAEYAAIRHCVFSDQRVYYAQAMNVFRVALNAFNYCYQAIPLGVFWVAAVLAIFTPNTLTEMVTAIQQATPSELKQTASMAGNLIALTMLLVVGIHWAFGISRFGFVNRFGEAVATVVRQKLSVAAEGAMVLTRWTSEGPLFNDETVFLRKRNSFATPTSDKA